MSKFHSNPHDIRYFQLYFELQESEKLPVCVCTANQVESITKHYGELYHEIVESNPLGLLIERVTSDPILQNWESITGVVLRLLDSEKLSWSDNEEYYYHDGYHDDIHWYELTKVSNG